MTDSIMNNTEIWTLFLALFNDLKDEDQFFTKKPLLAHYTSFDALEKILQSEEIWLSNPLFMNDREEVIFGFQNAAEIFRNSPIIKDALASDRRFEIFLHHYDQYVNQFEEEGLLDTYVFCFSEHPQGDLDGLLSMWRGYGADGRGAAVVLDTSRISPKDGTTLTLAQVHYLSNEERRAWISEKADQLATIIDSLNVEDDQIYLAANVLFDRIKLFSIFTKHRGFHEEREWRLVYLSGRGSDDGLPIEKHYQNTEAGIQPKLRLKLKQSEGLIDPSLSFENIIDSIIIGPGSQAGLTIPSVARMCELIGKPELKDRIVASKIPYRSS